MAMSYKFDSVVFKNANTSTEVFSKFALCHHGIQTYFDNFS